MAGCDWKCLPFPAVVAILIATAAAGVLDARTKIPGIRFPESFSCPANAPRATLAFTLPDLNGKAFNLASLAGHVVLLDFWATWCGPCRVEIPGFADLYAKDHARGLDVVGVMIQDDFDKAAPFAREMHITYPVLDGTRDMRLAEAFGVATNLPTSILIGRDGRSCVKHIGLPPVAASARDLKAATRAVFASEIDALLAPIR
jgi:thiol-disulfide isomerase/thioredoxin